MNAEKVRIIHHHAIQAKLKRMAYQIYEKNFEETELVFVGIHKRGGYTARTLMGLLKEISPIKLSYYQADREVEGGEITLEHPELAMAVKGKTVILVDDVLYSGGTMLTAVSRLMEFDPAKIRIAVLIDRGHRNYPVSPDYLGMDLATTLKQHVYVEVSEDETRAEAFLL